MNEDAVKNALLSIAKTPEEAQKLVQYLTSLDWYQVFSDEQESAQQALQARQQEIQEILASGGGYCNECDRLAHKLLSFQYPNPYTGKYWDGKYCLSCIKEFEKACDVSPQERLHRCGAYMCMTILPFKLLVHHEKIKAQGYGYCPSCLDRLIAEKTITCAVCGKETLEYTYPSTCDECYVRYPDRSTVIYHNGRAKALNLPANLTAEQWKQTVDHFDNKCAYCLKKPYQVLEHFVPLSKQGGTTVSNCVPACKSCNIRKKDKHPDTLGFLFPSDHLARIRAYLASQRV